MQTRKNYRRMVAAIGAVVTICALTAVSTNLFPVFSDDDPPARQVIESDAVSVVREGEWVRQAANSASGGAYLYNTGEAALSLQFSGTTLEIIYVSGPGLGTLAVEVDGTVLRTIITTADTTAYQQRTVINYLTDEAHTVRVYAQGGGVIGVDAFVASPVIEAGGVAAVDDETGGVFAAPCTIEGQIEQVSVTEDGQPASGGLAISHLPDVSSDGRYVVYASHASNLVANDTGNHRDIFLIDRIGCHVERISMGFDGTQPNASSYDPSINWSGRYITYLSSATNLVPNDTNGNYDIFLYDRWLGTTRRVSVATDGTQADSNALNPSISPEGDLVVYYSPATNLVPNDTNGQADVFVYHVQTGVTERVSVSNDEQQANSGGIIYHFGQAVGGGRVVFYSAATNLVAGDTNGFSDIFVRNLQAQTTVRVSVATDGTQGDDYVSYSVISADGRYVAFSSNADNLVGALDVTNGSDIFLRDLQTNQTTLISVTLAGTSGSGRMPRISANGQRVMFLSAAPAYVVGQQNGNYHFYVRDWVLGQTIRVSASAGGVPSNGILTDGGNLAASGDFAVFHSEANNLIPNDTSPPNSADIFWVDLRGRFAPIDCDANAAIQRISQSPTGDPSGRSLRAMISADGRYVVFESGAYNLTAPDVASTEDIDIFRVDRTTCEVVNLTAGMTFDIYLPFSQFAAMSPDANYIVFQSTANSAAPNFTNGIYLYDHQAGEISLVSVGTGGTQINQGVLYPSVSADGRYILFLTAGAVVPEDTNGTADWYVHDRELNITERVSVPSPGVELTPPGVAFNRAWISGDGRYVVFASGDNSVGGGTSRRDIFLHDRQTDQTILVSQSAGGERGNGVSSSPAISRDGRYIVFYSSATNLIANDTNNTPDLFLYDVQLGQLSRISERAGGEIANYANPSLSSDGRYVVFSSYATNLIPNDTTVPMLVRLDRQTGEFRRIVVNHDGTIPPSSGDDAISNSISDDGRWITFAAGSMTLAGDPFVSNVQGPFVYVRDMNAFAPTPTATPTATPTETLTQTATSTAIPSRPCNLNPITEMVSISNTGVPGRAYNYDMTGDGRFVTFGSITQLDPLDTNNSWDIYLYDRQTCVTRLISVNNLGQAGNNNSDRPSISDDGRYIAFESLASDLISGLPSGIGQVYIYDRQTGVMELISRATGGTPGSALSARPYVTADGRFVVFESNATNLASNDTDSNNSIYIHDRQTHETSVVSVDSNAIVGNGDSYNASVSNDGRLVAFSSVATNLVPNDTNAVSDVFVHDRQAGSTIRVSTRQDGSQTTLQSGQAMISGNGRFVVFIPWDRLSGNPIEFQRQVYLRDLQTGDLELISRTADGSFSDLGGDAPVITADGRFVYFPSQSTNLGDNNPDYINSWDNYIYDRQTMTLYNANRTYLGEVAQSGTNGGRGAISDDGTMVAFISNGANLMPEEHPTSLSNVYVHTRITGASPTPTPTSTSTPTYTPSSTATFTPTPTATETDTPSPTPTNTASVTPSHTPSNTPTLTPSDTPTNTATPTITATPSCAQLQIVSVQLVANNVQVTVQNNDPAAFYILQASIRWRQWTHGNMRLTSTQIISPVARSPHWTGSQAGSDIPNAYGTTVLNSSTLPAGSWRTNPTTLREFTGLTTTIWQISFNNGPNPLTSEYNANSFFGSSLSFEGGDANCVLPFPGQPPSATPGASPTPTNTVEATATNTPTATPSSTASNTPSVTPSNTATQTPSATNTPSHTPSNTPTATATLPPSATPNTSLNYDTLALQQGGGTALHLLYTLNTNPTAGQLMTYTVQRPATAQQVVMGDWNGDGQRTPGFLGTNGVFYTTNTLGAVTTGQWTATWFGLHGPAVAGRFDASVNYDCIGVVDSANMPGHGTAFALYYTCDLNGGDPAKSFQWLSVVLPDNQGHTGTHQFETGDWNGDGRDSVAIRRGKTIAFTNVAPGSGHAEFNLAQYWGEPIVGDEGDFVTGDWDGSGRDSFGVYYPATDRFYRRNDLDWNSGVHVLQQLPTSLTGIYGASSWRVR